MKRRKSFMSVCFLVVVAINMIWLLSFDSFATNEPPPQNYALSDTGQSFEEKEMENTYSPPIIVFFDFVFWKTIGEIVANLIKFWFARHEKNGKPKKKKRKKK